MKMKFKSVLAVTLALMLVVGCMTGCAKSGVHQQGSPKASGGVLCVRVNPEIAVTFDENGKVTKVEARNDDGQAILTDYTGYEGKETREVVTDLVTAIGDAGYFVEEVEGKSRKITIEVEPGTEMPYDGFLDEVISDVQNYVTTNDWHSDVRVEWEKDYDDIYDMHDDKDDLDDLHDDDKDDLDDLYDDDKDDLDDLHDDDKDDLDDLHDDDKDDLDDLYDDDKDDLDDLYDDDKDDLDDLHDDDKDDLDDLYDDDKDDLDDLYDDDKDDLDDLYDDDKYDFDDLYDDDKDDLDDLYDDHDDFDDLFDDDDDDLDDDDDDDYLAAKGFYYSIFQSAMG